MENTYNLISRYLKKKKWLFDGTQYVFRTAEWDKSLMVCLIDCILPEKGQSYTRTKFRYNFDDIMTDVYDVFGEKIAFDVDFFVDGEVAKEVYLSTNTKQKIRDGLKTLNWFKIKGKPPIDTKFSCELKVYPSTREPSSDNETVDFYYFWDVFNITFNDIPVEVEEPYYAEAKGYIESYMLDNDFSSDVSDIFYEACEQDFQFSNNELYIYATGFLRKIDGVDNGHGVWTNETNPTHFFRQRI
jgi:hypothetical protein